MFIRLVKYHLLIGLKNWGNLFWTLAFPTLILGNLFHLTLGNLDKEATFQSIPVAYVADAQADSYFYELLTALDEKDTPLIKMTVTDEPKAQKLLKEKEVAGIFYNNSKRHLVVHEEGISESILKTLLEEYERKQAAVENILTQHPESVAAALQSIETEVDMITEVPSTNGNMGEKMIYFYALLAMGCLFGSFHGVDCVIRFKANLSDMGARRLTSATNRFILLFSDVCAQCLLQIFCSIVTLLYIIFVLRVDLTANFAHILLILLLGSVVGVLMGMCIAAIGRSSVEMKGAIASSVSLAACFLSGLMVGDMYYIVAQNVPFLNRINPAALIVDSFYSLNIYDNYNQYTLNILSLLAIAVLLCLCSFLAVRRERYASL